MSGAVGIIIIAVVVVIVVIALIFFFISRRNRAQRGEEHRERTREEFGGEYDRAVEEHGSDEEAERELRRRRGSVEKQVQPLSDESRGRYEEQWAEVERVFVENPERSIEMADRTVTDILGERRFVADTAQSDEKTERDLAVMHPEVADDYREARRMRADVVSRGARSTGDEESTEDLRQAIRRYRAVYEKLIGG